MPFQGSVISFLGPFEATESGDSNNCFTSSSVCSAASSSLVTSEFVLLKFPGVLVWAGYVRGIMLGERIAW